MSFLIQIREKLIFLKKILKNNSENFEDHHIVWEYLNQADLSSEEMKILKSSFRTRIKPGDNLIIFQFRISPTSLLDTQKQNIPNTTESLRKKLQKLILTKNIEVQIKISDCCNSNCYGCTTFNKK